MNKAMDIEGSRILAVLEDCKSSLELIATIPEQLVQATHKGVTRDAAMTLLPIAKFDQLEKHLALEHVAVCYSRGNPNRHRRHAEEEEDDEDDEDDDADEDTDEEEDDDEVEDVQDQPESTIGPETDQEPHVDDNDAAMAKQQLDQVASSLHLLTRSLQHEKPLRDSFRKLSSAFVSDSLAHLALALQDLILFTESRLATSIEEDERQVDTLLESQLHINELHQDRQQIQLELTRERQERLQMDQKSLHTINELNQVLETTRQQAQELLETNERTGQHDQMTCQSHFDLQKTSCHEKILTLSRNCSRLNEENRQMEHEERKKTQRLELEIQEIIDQYDTAMSHLALQCQTLRDETQVLQQQSDLLETHFMRIDEDLHNQLQEMQKIQEEMLAKRQKDLRLYGVVQKIQALVRGFLVRRQYRFAHAKGSKKKKKKKKKTKKKKGQTKKTTQRTGKKKKSGSSPSPTKKKSLKK